MIEKVNPKHPDKVADRIAGAIVDLAYRKINEKTDSDTVIHPKVAVEVLLGHGACTVIVETSEAIKKAEITDIVYRIAGYIRVNTIVVPQDAHLANNQSEAIRCGDNGIFKGMPLTEEQKTLSNIARKLYSTFPHDGKYILADGVLTVCQSNADDSLIRKLTSPDAIVNPLGYWTGGIDVDSGATNRKLGSDMADSVTGGGLHGKDLSKADVSVNIYAFLKAQKTGKPVELSCSIGDTVIDGTDYQSIVNIAYNYINNIGGFEKFAEWGLF